MKKEILGSITAKEESVLIAQIKEEPVNNGSKEPLARSFIDDLFYRLETEQNFKIDFDTIDKIIENVITVALRRFHD